jgi:large subunit ribosomal protein L18
MSGKTAKSGKKDTRVRRAQKSRIRMRQRGTTRLCVHRTPRHIYAQLIAPAGDRVLVSASTLDTAFKGAKTGNVDAAQKVGQMIAERAKSAGVEKVAFDRSGFKYHGRVKALADAAREGGLEF